MTGGVKRSQRKQNQNCGCKTFLFLLVSVSEKGRTVTSCNVRPPPMPQMPSCGNPGTSRTSLEVKNQNTPAWPSAPLEEEQITKSLK
jgi:hypothetical protein